MCFLAAIGALALILVACFAMSRALHGIFRIIRCYQDLKEFQRTYAGSLGLAGTALKMLVQEYGNTPSKYHLYEELRRVIDRLDASDSKATLCYEEVIKRLDALEAKGKKK